MSRSISRNVALALASAVVSMMVTSCGDAATGADSRSEDEDVGAAAAALVSFSTPLPLPPVLAPTRRSATTDYYHLTIRPGTTQMKPGAPTPIVGFNGIFPGPTIIATRGRTVKVTQTNGWDENVSIHNHGAKVAASSDGHPTDYIVPGASKTYTYPNDQRAGTYWYHDHTMDLTGPHVYKGIAGFYLIHDPAEDSLNLPAGPFDIPLLIQDKTFDDSNALVYTAGAPGTFGLEQEAVVNGVVTPYLNVAARKYRFRVLNGATARGFDLSLSNGASFQVIGSDGGLLASPVSVTSLAVAPAERYDIVVDFSSYARGTTIELRNTDPEGMPEGVARITSLMQFVVTTRAIDRSAVPSTLSTITRLSESSAVGTASISFSVANGEWMMNGVGYDPARIDITSSLNQVTIWELVNNSPVPHPFHKHLSQFNVLDVNGGPPRPEEMGWKDTVMVPPEGTARIIFKNEDFKGIYVFHCHNLAHEDSRMMLQEEVR